MKKIASLLALSLAVCMFAGCSDKVSETKKTEQTSSVTKEEEPADTSGSETSDETDDTDVTEDTGVSDITDDTGIGDVSGTVWEFDDNKLTVGSDEYVINYENDKNFLVINGEGYEMLHAADDADAFNVYGAWLVQLDSGDYIYSKLATMDDGSELDVYSIGNDGIELIATYNGWSIYNSELDADSFLMIERHPNGGFANPVSEFTIGDDGIPVQTLDYWTFYSPSIVVYSFNEDITGTVVWNGELMGEKTIPAEDEVFMIDTDKETYIDFGNNDGDVIRVFYQESDDAKSLEEYWNMAPSFYYMDDALKNLGGGIHSYIDAGGQTITFDD